jgi:hypothetical protein
MGACLSFWCCGIHFAPRVAILLMHLPNAAGSKREAPSVEGDASCPTKKQKGAKPNAKFDAPVKGRGKEIGIPKMPNELLGMSAAHGVKRICFSSIRKLAAKKPKLLQVQPLVTQLLRTRVRRLALK